MDELKIRRITAMVIIIILSIFLFIALMPYIKPLFGALIMYTLFRPMYKQLRKWNVNQKVSAGIVIITSILVIIIPLSLVGTLALSEVTTLAKQTDKIDGLISGFKEITGLEFELSQVFTAAISQFVNFLKGQIPTILSSVSLLLISLVIMYFVMYYLLINTGKSTKVLLEYIPFNRKNSRRLIAELKAVTKSTVVGMGIIALIQGALVTIAFIVTGIPGAVFWGMMSAILSFLPILGAPLVWVPAGIILLLEQQYLFGIALLLFGFLIISNVDNILRPIITRKMANLHPLITLIGAFIGIPIFGILGIIIGPLLLSYFFLLIKMFKEEYLPAKHDSARLP